MRLLEIVRGSQTDVLVLATAVTLAREVDKIGVTVGVCDGFCANRMLYPIVRWKKGRCRRISIVC